MHMPTFPSAGPGSGALDPALRVLLRIGLIGFLGGFAALGSMWAFGSMPDDAAQWKLCISLMRAVFYSCVFAGVVVIAVSGGVLWWRQRRALHAARWFRIMMPLVVLAIPAFHVLGRVTALRLYDAVDEHRLGDAAALWNTLGVTYVSAFLVLTALATIGWIKPRLGQSP